MTLEEKDYDLLATWHDINTKFGVLNEIQKVENSNYLVNILNQSILHQNLKYIWEIKGFLSLLAIMEYQNPPHTTIKLGNIY